MSKEFITKNDLWDKCFNVLRRQYATKVPIGWEYKIDAINDVCGIVNRMNVAEPVPSQGEARKPVFEERTSTTFSCRTDGSGEVETKHFADWFCPVCGWFVGEQFVPRNHNQNKANFCSQCGQKIDWEGVEEDTK